MQYSVWVLILAWNNFHKSNIWMAINGFAGVAMPILGKKTNKQKGLFCTKFFWSSLEWLWYSHMSKIAWWWYLQKFWLETEKKLYQHSFTESWTEYLLFMEGKRFFCTAAAMIIVFHQVFLFKNEFVLQNCLRYSHFQLQWQKVNCGTCNYEPTYIFCRLLQVLII